MLVLCTLLFWAAMPAMAQEPGQGVYWSISKGNQPVGFLLGTIHSEDPRVVDFNESFIADLNSCDVFAMEMVPDLPTLKKLTETMHFQDETRLRTVLGEQRFERTMNVLSGYQVPDDWKARMKVWAVMMTLSVPPPQTGFFMDLSLSLRAAGSGLKVIGLETLEQQLQFLEQMPLEFQIKLLDHALDDYVNVAELHDQMVDVYLQDDLSELDGLSRQQFAALEDEISEYFTQLGIVARNRQMMNNLVLELMVHKVFVAVGALHLPGQDGLVNLLREAGYELRPLPPPFNATGKP